MSFNTAKEGIRTRCISPLSYHKDNTFFSDFQISINTIYQSEKGKIGHFPPPAGALSRPSLPPNLSPRPITGRESEALRPTPPRSHDSAGKVYGHVCIRLEKCKARDFIRPEKCTKTPSIRLEKCKARGFIRPEKCKLRRIFAWKSVSLQPKDTRSHYA